MATQHLHISCPSFVRGKRQHRYFDAPMEYSRSLMANDQTTGYQVKGFELKISRCNVCDFNHVGYRDVA